MTPDRKSSSCNPSRFARLLTAFSSPKTAVILLTATVVASAVGTIVPQNTQGTALMTRSIRDEILLALDLHDVFHSWWFFLLGVLVCVSLVLCTWRRIRSRITVPKRAGLLFRRGDLPRLGSLLLHLGAVIVIAGFVYGQFQGIDAYVEIPEGETVSLAPIIPGHQLDQDLSIRCEDFSVEYYDSGIPREFRSELAFISSGAVLKRETLLVNHPVSFQGIRYYQAHYKRLPRAVLSVDDSGQPRTFTARPGDVYTLGAETFFRVTRVEENFMDMGPAMKIDFFSPAQSGYVWVLSGIEKVGQLFPDLLAKAPQFDPARFEGYVFSLERMEPLYVTGISISHDPGLPVVVMGMLLFVSGLFVVYLLPGSQRRALKKDRIQAGEP